MSPEGRRSIFVSRGSIPKKTSLSLFDLVPTCFSSIGMSVQCADTLVRVRRCHVVVLCALAQTAYKLCTLVVKSDMWTKGESCLELLHSCVWKLPWMQQATPKKCSNTTEEPRKLNIKNAKKEKKRKKGRSFTAWTSFNFFSLIWDFQLFFWHNRDTCNNFKTLFWQIFPLSNLICPKLDF